MNRKTSISILFSLAVLIVGVGAITAIMYWPDNGTPAPDSEIKGARTTSRLETMLEYLTAQVSGLKQVERNLRLAQPLLDPATSATADTRLHWMSNSRLELLNLRAKAQAFTVPEEARAAHEAYLTTLDVFIRMYEHQSTALTAEQNKDDQSQFSFVDANRAYEEGQAALGNSKIQNGEALRAAGAKFSDTDGDALPDVWEHIAGSDITLVDTDEDGLSDGEEFNHFLTKPNLPDTDADGFLDGVEVSSGYNPLGEGLLLKE
ncbi:MAG: hypothetical protein Q8Q20_05365 [bacterium]|nr:hypothetical protein [bacterium]